MQMKGIITGCGKCDQENSHLNYSYAQRLKSLKKLD
jgi:hypothetical protein